MAKREGRQKGVDILGVLPNLVRRILTQEDSDRLLPELLTVARNFSKANEISLLMVDGEELYERQVVGRRLRPAYRLRIGKEGVAGWVAAQKKPLILEDVGRDGRYVCASEDTCSEAAVPVLMGDTLVGVLNFESSHRGHFDDASLPLLNFLASQVAVALGLLQHMEQEQRGRHCLAMFHHLARYAASLPPEAYLNRVCDAVRRTFQVSYAAVYRGDYENEEGILLAQSSAKPVALEIGETVKFGSGLIGATFKLGELRYVKDVDRDPIYVARVPEIQSEACIPVRKGDNCLGLLDAQSRAPAAFSPDDLHVLETLAQFLVPTLQALPRPART